MLTALHTVFLREHNKNADKLQQMHPDWDDELVYQVWKATSSQEDSMHISLFYTHTRRPVAS